MTYKQNTAGVDCIRIRLDGPTVAGEVTTHVASTAFDKVLDYAGASLSRDDVDERYMNEARTGTATYKGSVTKTPGRIDLVSDVNGYTEANFGTGSHPADFDADKDGMADAWEIANGLNPANAADALSYSLDPKSYYTNLEVYCNSLVQDIMLGGNADGDDAVKEYYPAYKKEDGTPVEAINGDGEVPNPNDDPSGEEYSVMFNGSDVQSTDGYFTFGDGKHNFNSKFQGKYNDMVFSQGLKMEGTTLIAFTTTAASTITIVQSTWSDHTIKLDGTELALASATVPEGSEGVRVYSVAGVGSGEHQIKRGSGESGVFLVIVRYNGTSGVSLAGNSTVVTGTEYYNLQGQRVNRRQHGVVIQSQTLSDGTRRNRMIINK